MSKIILDIGSFKALAASKRIKILKLLNQKPHTQTELAKELSMKPASVNDHLKALKSADLIFQKDEGRKWKYYYLTEKAKCILEPERKTIWITLVVLVFSFIGTMLSYGMEIFKESENYMLTVSEAELMSKSSYAIKPEERVMDAAPMIEKTPKIIETAATQTNYLLLFFLILTGITLLFLVFLLGKYLIKKRYLNN